jgi:hypothetical protein
VNEQFARFPAAAGRREGNRDGLHGWRGCSKPTGSLRKSAGRVAVTLLASLLLGSLPATRDHRPSTKRIAIDDAARRYVRLAVALGERDSDSIDYYYGPPEWVADIRRNPPPLREIKRLASALAEELSKASLRRTSEEQRRRGYLLAQLRAIECRVDFLAGTRFTFDQESACVFGVKVPATFDHEKLTRIRHEIARLLGGENNLTERYAAFDEKHLIPPKRVPAVMARAIRGCRERTTKHITLPQQEHISIEYVGHEPWSGYSSYEGGFYSRIAINTSFALTVDRALDLACHETYPGHHTFNTVEDANLAHSLARPEFLVQPTYSPQSLLSEAAATLAGQIAFPQEDRIQFERDELFPLAGLDSRDVERYVRVERLVDQLHEAVPVIARKYVDGKLEFVRAGEALEREALMVHSFETLKYLNEYRTYVIAYTYGEDILSKRLPGHLSSEEFERERWSEYQRWMTAGGL